MTVVAESFSGPIAMRLAANPPPSLKAVVLVATFVRSPVPRWLRFFARPAVFRLDPRVAFIAKQLTGGDVQLATRVAEAVQQVKPEVMAHRAREIMRVDCREALSRARIPILSLRAGQDRLVRANVSPGAFGVRETVVDGPHLLLQTRPVEGAQAINNFTRATH